MWKIILIFTILASKGLAQFEAKGWNGVQPLHTTKADVEKKLGRPLEGFPGLYDTNDERVSIWYSGRPCSNGIWNWNVPKDTVITLLVSPKNAVPVQPLLTSLGQKFDHGRDPEMSDRFFYVNEDGSIKIDTRRRDGLEDVLFVAYSPTKFDSNLRCPNDK